ncbi:MAG: hypothetical protein EOP48_22545 [Sphingobacteriales bacterium]|nr:MAG: hypothetical protein EOP48_22545 [Sphingobacteriales bacterium]
MQLDDIESVMTGTSVPTEGCKRKKAPKPGSIAWKALHAPEKRKREEDQRIALEKYQIRQREREIADNRRMLEADYYLKLNNEIKNSLKAAVESFHAEERRNERAIGWERIRGALNIDNVHRKVVGMCSEYNRYGTLSVNTDNDRDNEECCPSLVLEDEKGEISFPPLLVDDVAQMRKIFPCKSDIGFIRDPITWNKTIDVVFSCRNGKLRILLDPDNERKRHTFCNKKVLFGREDNPHRLAVIMNWNMSKVITMFFL